MVEWKQSGRFIKMTAKKVKLPGEDYTKQIRARFWLAGHNGGYVGIGRVELLEHIAEQGSINRAAKKMGMSYKKAWKLIEELNSMYENPLVVKEQGGKLGGGTQLTVHGEKLIKEFRQLEVELIEFLASKTIVSK